jgi:hypothetical protein
MEMGRLRVSDFVHLRSLAWNLRLACGAGRYGGRCDCSIGAGYSPAPARFCGGQELCGLERFRHFGPYRGREYRGARPVARPQFLRSCPQRGRLRRTILLIMVHSKYQMAIPHRSLFSEMKMKIAPTVQARGGGILCDGTEAINWCGMGSCVDRCPNSNCYCPGCTMDIRNDRLFLYVADTQKCLHFLSMEICFRELRSVLASSTFPYNVEAHGTWSGACPCKFPVPAGKLTFRRHRCTSIFRFSD